eukprot:m.417173 g.417173  ORF g.417173 m.417173 type:complete len:69 (-) comp56617_c0_seq3:153-359(-)
MTRNSGLTTPSSCPNASCPNTIPTPSSHSSRVSNPVLDCLEHRVADSFPSDSVLLRSSQLHRSTLGVN